MRVWLIGLCLIAAGRGLWRSPYLSRWAWARFVPSMPLVRVERVLGTTMPEPLRDEVAQRLAAGVLSPRDSDAAIASLIADLRDDGVPGNGLRALYRLAALGSAAVPALERALESEDWQMRQLSAAALREIPSYEPSERMLRVTVEGLKDDDLPRQAASAILGRRGAYSGIANASEGVEYLRQYPERVGAVLRDGMAAQDVQQRLLCAVVAGATGRRDLIPIAGPILIGHLRANHIAGDAKLAAAALYALGPEVAPMLEPVLDSPDVQQRDLARLILIDLGVLHPPDAGERRHLTRITEKYLDPAVDGGPWVEDLE